MLAAPPGGLGAENAGSAPDPPGTRRAPTEQVRQLQIHRMSNNRMPQSVNSTETHDVVPGISETCSDPESERRTLDFTRWHPSRWRPRCSRRVGKTRKHRWDDLLGEITTGATKRLGTFLAPTHALCPQGIHPSQARLRPVASSASQSPPTPAPPPALPEPVVSGAAHPAAGCAVGFGLNVSEAWRWLGDPKEVSPARSANRSGA